MPCRDETHKHSWSKTGTLTICKCEIFCGYCEGEGAKKVYALQWELRHHIRVVHAGSQGLDIKVSPRPMSHMSANSKKRNHAEVEQDDTDEEAEDDESSEEEEKATEDDSSEEDSKKKTKPAILHSRAPSDPFVDADKKNTDSAPGPLRLRAKAVAKPTKAPLSTHAASFRPIGPRSGPSSPKRAKQEATTRPPAPVAGSMAPGLPPQAPGIPPQAPRTQQGAAQPGAMNGPLVNSVLCEQRRAQLVARHAAEVEAGMNFQRPTGNLQQMPNNVQPQSRNNTGLSINTQPGQTARPNYGRRPLSAGFYPNNHMNIVPPPVHLSSSDQDFYRRGSQFPEQHQDIPPELLRIRSLTKDLLTNHNTSELLLINMYTAELEFIRQLQTRRWMSNVHDQVYVSTISQTAWLAQRQVQQQLSPQLMQHAVGYVHGQLMNRALHNQQIQGQGGQQQMNQQQGVLPGQQPGLQSQQGPLQPAPHPLQQTSAQYPSQAQQTGGQFGVPQPQQLGQRQFSGGQQHAQRQVSGGQQRHVQAQIFAGQQPVAQQADPQQPGPHQPGVQQLGPQQLGSRQLGLQQLEPQQPVARPYVPRPLPSRQVFGNWLPGQQRPGTQQQNGAQQSAYQPAYQPTEHQQHDPSRVQGQALPRDPAQMKVGEQTRSQTDSQDKKSDDEKIIKEETV